jgi:ABC-type nickel/cobalt efflux system permease component RcnA
MLTFLTGFIASVAHVATGPDHLAAVTPLAIDSRKKSWIIGFSWGFGHTAGMLLIGALFMVFKEFLPVESISRHSDTAIGFLLIGIGCWALVRLYRRHTHGYKPHAHFHTRPFLYPHIHKHTHADDTNQDYHNGQVPDNGHGHVHTGKVRQNAFSAFLIGTVHGFAGFSHLFALLPSLALPTLLASVIYIIAFATGTILTMIIFAFILGIVAHRSEVKDQQRFLKWFSLTGAVLAIAIGVLWIFHPIG